MHTGSFSRALSWTGEDNPSNEYLHFYNGRAHMFEFLEISHLIKNLRKQEKQIKITKVMMFLTMQMEIKCIDLEKIYM